MRFLQKQTNRERIELIFLGPEDSSFDDLDSALVAGFARCHKMAVGPIEEVERAFAIPRPFLNELVRRKLAHHFAPEVARLKTLIGREFSEWSW